MVQFGVVTYLILAKSCRDCNLMALRLISHKPAWDEIREVENEAGGMFCITSKVFELELDGETIKSQIVEY